jgi:hypothetical protein
MDGRGDEKEGKDKERKDSEDVTHGRRNAGKACVLDLCDEGVAGNNSSSA